MLRTRVRGAAPFVGIGTAELVRCYKCGAPRKLVFNWAPAPGRGTCTAPGRGMVGVMDDLCVVLAAEFRPVGMMGGGALTDGDGPRRPPVPGCGGAGGAEATED